MNFSYCQLGTDITHSTREFQDMQIGYGKIQVEKITN